MSVEKVTTQQILKQIMEERGLRQVDIINKSLPYQKQLNIKMSKNHLSNYINGRSTPDAQRILLLSKTLGVNPSYLMGHSKIENELEFMNEAVDTGELITTLLEINISDHDNLPESSKELYTPTKEIIEEAYDLTLEERQNFETVVYNLVLMSTEEREDVIRYSEFLLSKRGYIVPSKDNK